MPSGLASRLRSGSALLHLGRNATDADVPTMARVGAALFAAGGTLGVISLVFPAGDDRNVAGLVAVIVLAYAGGAAMAFVLPRGSPWMFELFSAIGTMLVSLSLYFGGPGSGFYRFFYVWIVLFAAYFFSWERTAAQLALIAVSYGVVEKIGSDEGAGALVWLLTVSTLLVAAALVTILRGRSERALEVEREHVERLLALDRLKDELVATVSHELRTPLTSVYGAAQTLRRPDLDTETRRQLLAVVTQESSRLAHLVEDVLLASRIDTGQLELSIEPCDADAVARGVLEGARLTAPLPIALELESPPGLPPVAADAERLGQVLSNLVDNAVKYSPDGGSVHVELSGRDGSVRFAVRDRGLGIAEADRELIFEKFHRLDPDMRRGVGGTGLGLYVSRALVEQMGGRIWVESAPGDGSTFFVELPAAA